MDDDQSFATNEQPFEPVVTGDCIDCKESELLNERKLCSSCQFVRDHQDPSAPWFTQPEDTEDSAKRCDDHEDDDNEFGGPEAPALV